MSRSRFFISFAEYRRATGTTAELIAQSPGASAEKNIFGGEWHFGPPLGMKAKGKGLEKIGTTENKRLLQEEAIQEKKINNTPFNN
jgi:hypothetical protein